MAKSSAKKYRPSSTAKRSRSDSNAFSTGGTKRNLRTSQSTTSSPKSKKERPSKAVTKGRSQLNAKSSKIRKGDSDKSINNRRSRRKKRRTREPGLGTLKPLVGGTVAANVVILSAALTLFAFKIICDLEPPGEENFTTWQVTATSSAVKTTPDTTILTTEFEKSTPATTTSMTTTPEIITVPTTTASITTVRTTTVPSTTDITTQPTTTVPTTTIPTTIVTTAQTTTQPTTTVPTSTVPTTTVPTTTAPTTTAPTTTVPTTTVPTTTVPTTTVPTTTVPTTTAPTTTVPTTTIPDVTSTPTIFGAPLPPELITPGLARSDEIVNEAYEEDDEYDAFEYSCGYPDVKPNLDNMNGGEAVDYSWPYTIRLLRLDFSTSESDPMYIQFKQICAATLISPKHAITAALCFVDRDMSSTYVGLAEYPDFWDFVTGDKRFRTVRTIRLHPKTNLYSGYPAVTYDFALITFSLTFEIHKKGIGLACLPTPELSLPPGTICWASGWGWTDPRSGEENERKIRQVSVDLVSEFVCQRDFYVGVQYKSTFCGGSDSDKDTCIGGTGAPLYCYIDSNWTLYGISSYGRREICGTDYLTPYGAVSFQMEWLCCYLPNLPPCADVECVPGGAH